ncbi:hypothetical protein A4X09_0g5703 [Tilletia walkeri]|uniref:Uncharacterized protein n=1 Tax=Tilletia walkeri TaxID=117179 RepID=A0A8X7N3Z7_9BASI|nr:hypothetical protein A4X09_0g5703 [Tilletia walkeri]
MVDYGLSKTSGRAATAAALGRAPDVFPPRWFRNLMGSIFSPRVAGAMPGVLPRLPPWLRTFLTLLVILNVKNFPGVWHIRLFWSPILFRMRAVPAIHPLLPWISSNAYPTREPGAEPPLKLDSLPLGKDIFDYKTTWTFYADLADSDWNMHLSNSCYAARLDFVRAEHVQTSFVLSHFDGCGWALGGTIFNYHREVPIFSKYAITVQVAGWDNKWMYLVARWTPPPDNVDEEAAEVLEQTKPKRSLSTVEMRKFAASVLQSQREADAKDKGKGKVDDGSGAVTPEARSSSDNTTATSKKSASTTVYATAVSRYCFKAGRKTIPPWFIVATSGFGRWASTRENFEKAEALRIQTLAVAKREYAARAGSELPRDGLWAGRGHRKHGICRLYDPSRPEGSGPSDQRGLGAYQDQASWSIAEWEDRRVRGLEALEGYGCVLAPPSKTLSAAAVSALGTPTGMGTPLGAGLA